VSFSRIRGLLFGFFVSVFPFSPPVSRDYKRTNLFSCFRIYIDSASGWFGIHGAKALAWGGNMAIMGLSGFLNAMFGCTHKNYSFPFTPKDRHSSAAAGPTGTYVVCLGCGKEFPYDWHEMKVVSGNASPSEAHREAVKYFVNPL
jgi:hypothetical protein